MSNSSLLVLYYSQNRFVGKGIKVGKRNNKDCVEEVQAAGHLGYLKLVSGEYELLL